MKEFKISDLLKLKLEEFVYTTTIRGLDPNSNVINGPCFPIAPKCSNCNGMLTKIKDYIVGFDKLVFPQCGYEKNKLNTLFMKIFNNDFY
ncbi:MAG: hypothetical protein V3V33_15880 [Candidatus Lokiarchaeia archaeon]